MYQGALEACTRTLSYREGCPDLPLWARVCVCVCAPVCVFVLCCVHVLVTVCACFVSVPGSEHLFLRHAYMCTACEFFAYKCIFRHFHSYYKFKLTYMLRLTPCCLHTRANTLLQQND